MRVLLAERSSLGEEGVASLPGARERGVAAPISHRLLTPPADPA